MTELLLCLAALAVGPVLYQISRTKASTYAFFDGFVLVGVGSLLCFDILPDTVAALGLWAIPVSIFGFIFPHFLEHRLGSLPVSPRTILSGLIIAGLIIHQLFDGVALSLPSAHDTTAHAKDGGHDHTRYGLTLIAIAVILHQVPKGFLLWEISRKAGGWKAAVVVIGGLLGVTMTGFLAGEPVLDLIRHDVVLGFQAFVAGGLLHVVVHHVSGTSLPHEHRRIALWGGIGALTATAGFALLPHVHGVEPLSDKAEELRAAFLHFWLDSAPSILLGFAASGLLQAFVSLRALAWLGGRNRVSQALRGITFGMPLPICSCGVTPVYKTLIERGVPPAAAVSFLIATPEIGVDSFFLSLGLLGPQVTAIRLAMAFVVAFLAACILSGPFSKTTSPGKAPEGKECWSDGRGSFSFKLRAAARHGFVDLVDHLGAWILAGIAVAALIEPYWKEDWLAGMPAGLEVVLFALLGLPMYVCASGATPMAAALLVKGISPGAVLAFLITGPTTNVTTIGILGRVHGARRALAFPLTVFGLAVACGLLIDFLFPRVSLPHTAAGAETSPSLLAQVCAVALATLIIASILRSGPRRFLGKLSGEESLGQVEDEGGAARGHDHAHAH
jgi:hypothetical protein